MNDGARRGGCDCSQIETTEFRQRLRHGGEEAWTKLVLCLQRLLECVAFAAGARGAQIEDAVDETWLRAYRNRAGLDPSRPITPWLAVICKNFCRDEFRKQRPGLLGDEQPAAASEQTAAGTRVPWERLAKLPLSEREAIVLHFCYGLSPADVAEMLDVSVDAVYQRLSRGIRRLRDERGGANDE